MRDRDLYSKILGISVPWHVTDALLDMPGGKVEVVRFHVARHLGEAVEVGPAPSPEGGEGLTRRGSRSS